MIWHGCPNLYKENKDNYFAYFILKIKKNEDYLILPLK